MLEISKGLTAIMVLAWTHPAAVQAQIGLSSSVAQVALTVRAAPRVSVPVVSRPREAGRQGDLRDAVVNLRFSANGAHRLTVRRSESGRTSRVWVRALDGAYHEVIAGSAVTVARGDRSAGEWEREVSYRIELREGETSLELPVRYDIAVDPTI